MPLSKSIQLLEQTLFDRRLTDSEHQVLLQVIQGKSYAAIAQDTSYVEGYLKVVGSKLWRELSNRLNQKVTKKNVHSILNDYLLGVQVPSSSVNTGQDGLMGAPMEFQLDASIEEKQCPRLDGPIPIGSSFYIERPPLEQLAYEEISRSGCLLRLKAPCKYGKSSLLLRLIQYVETLKFKAIFIDFQEAEQDTLEHLDSLLRWICANVIRQLELPTDLETIWLPALGSKLNFKGFLQDHVFGACSNPIVLGFNEVNQLFEHRRVAQDFLPMIRSFYEQAQSSERWRKLHLVMAYTTDAYVPLNIKQSPFNVGLPLCLPPFNLAQAIALSEKYGLQSLNDHQMDHLMQLLGGQPYLLNRAFYAMAIESISLGQLLETAATPTGIYGPYLHGYLTVLREQPALVEALTVIMERTTPVQVDQIAAYRLASMGIVVLDGYRASISCDLYRNYFRNTLLQVRAMPA
ncbi:MAG: AAA-like domain-containing protein [Cyanobacteria bacterium P01_F01_bin.150]